MEGWVEHLLDAGVLTSEREPEWLARKQRYLDGVIDHNQFADEANREFARALAGWSLQQTAPLARRFVAETDRLLVYRWAAPLLRWLTDHGTRPVIVSGAPQELLLEHLQQVGLTDVEPHGLTLALDQDGRYTGAVAANVGTDTAKRVLVQHLAAAAGPGAIVLGVGDSSSDLPLLHAADRQLIVGRHAHRLLEDFGPTAAAVPDPQAAAADDMIALVSELLES